ncbi:replication restart helicase PriA [Segetibacter aerophilus]|uniref:Replication restart protein PriA n=1 Tax=Segetibacter aerophilus TaxID=670293 RepID=A0A512BAK9_9BACT|nr:primosomal protein N' [Segetibacter aerophilus]GEO08996.1 primosomal protein N' [Segetibacter aerophilus]
MAYNLTSSPLFSPDPNEGVYAEVIIPLALPRNYTWAIPTHLRANISKGSRVEVQLKNKKYSGIVKTIHTDKPTAFEPRDILNLLEEQPLIYPQQLKLWEWIGDYYMCSEGEVMQAALPSHLKLSSESILTYNEEFGENFSDLNDEEYLVAEALLLKKELKLSEVQQILDAAHVYPIIKGLIEKKVCMVWEALKDTYKQKLETYVHLEAAYHNEENLAKLLNEWSKNKAPKQLELLLSYLHVIRTEGEVTQTNLLKKANASSAQLKGLADKNIVRLEKRSVDRLPTLPRDIKIDFELSAAQVEAAESVERVLNEKSVCLLQGVTSSGKTQIYIKLIEQYIKAGKQVLYMLPEIALTAQIIRRLQKYFGGYITIYHSKFNPNERVEIWNKIKTGETKVVLGARSSLFLPFKELGLIIVDEEHDPSFKQQEPAPRYHGRDAAIYYASLYNAKVLLGSATPSIESYFNTQAGKYGLVNLTERYGNVQMPAIQIVDVKTIITKEKGKIILSPQLTEAIQQSLQEKKQVILFQNRRGYSPYQICGVCGWIPQCENCDVTLTYHKAKNKLQCHYCGTSYPLVLTCAACGNHNFVQKNFGTEKIEEALVEAFPEAKIARMDYDSIRGKNDHDALIKLFEQQKIDILAGTQMVVKGLDFEHVNLVGIVDADGILNFTDFRVNERAFQLMEQVSGRAGRREAQGKVIVQVSNTHHPVLQFVQHHSYEEMYRFEIENRKNFFYPPFSRVIQLICKHKDKNIAEEAANILGQFLNDKYAAYVSGPAEPAINRVRNQYLYELLLKLPKDAQFLRQCKQDILQQVSIVQSNKRYRSVTIVADVDAV